MRACLVIAISAIAVACSNGGEYRSTAERYLTELNATLPNYEIDQIEIRDDTIPAYFSDELFSLAERAAMGLEWFNRASENRRIGIPTTLIYDMQKQRSITEEELADDISKAKSAIDSARRNGLSVVKRVAYVDSHFGANDNITHSKEIVILDNDHPKQVLAYHRANKMLADNLFTLLFLSPDGALKHDAFGNPSFITEPYIVRYALTQR